MHDVRPAAVAGMFYPERARAPRGRHSRVSLATLRAARAHAQGVDRAARGLRLLRADRGQLRYALLAPLRDVGDARRAARARASRGRARARDHAARARSRRRSARSRSTRDAVGAALTFAQVVGERRRARARARARSAAAIPADGAALVFARAVRRRPRRRRRRGRGARRAVGRAGDARGRELGSVALPSLTREAKRIDRATADAILAMSPTLDHEQACGATPINGLLQCAKRRGLSPTLLDLRNSGDTAGDRARVVGYASFAFRWQPMEPD